VQLTLRKMVTTILMARKNEWDSLVRHARLPPTESPTTLDYSIGGLLGSLDWWQINECPRDFSFGKRIERRGIDAACARSQRASGGRQGWLATQGARIIGWGQVGVGLGVLGGRFSEGSGPLQPRIHS
jgi:hypothetical protein